MKTSLMKRLSLAVGAAILFASALSGATTLLSLDLNALVFRADHIVVGRVVDSWPFMKDNRVYTLHRVEVTTPLSSDTKEHDILEVATEGGRTEEFAQRVEGAAELEVGEEYLLFLDIRGDFGSAYVTGMAQGAYPVSADDSSNVKYVHPPNHLPLLMSRDTATARLKENGFWMKEKKSLSSMVEEIRTMIRGGK